jgi:hypothetical protein
VVGLHSKSNSESRLNVKVPNLKSQDCAFGMRRPHAFGMKYLRFQGKGPTRVQFGKARLFFRLATARSSCEERRPEIDCARMHLFYQTEERRERHPRRARTAVANSTATRRSALLIAHPGHELRVYGWSRMAHPRVDILTDGSGAGGCSRLKRSAELLSSMGAERGAIFGRFSDREIYLEEMVDQIAETWIEARIEVVASDAREGFNPTHDLCCEVAKAASELVFRETGRRLEGYTFCLAEWDLCSDMPLPFAADALRIRLDDRTLEDKIAAAKSYCELGKEVERALALKGRDYFRDECLLPEAGWATQNSSYKPFYETFGEQRVAEGTYTKVLRYGKHVLPILQALREHASCMRFARRQRAASA